MMHDTPKVITRARINGDIVTIDLASDFRQSYAEAEQKGEIEYLGEGFYYSYNESLAKDQTPAHFWRKKKPIDLSEVANTLETIAELTHLKNTLLDAYKTSCDQFYIMAVEIIELRKQRTELIELAEQLNDPSKHGRPSAQEVDDMLAKYKTGVQNLVKS